MAHPAKVREFLVASEMEAMFSLATKGTLEQMRLDQLLKGKLEEAALSDLLSQFIGRVQTEVINHMASLIGEQFTDEEMDTLIAFHSSPVAHKMRLFAPELHKEMVTFFSDGEVRFGAIIEELLEAMEQ